MYKEESQLKKKRKGRKRKATSPLKTDSKVKSTKKSPEMSKVRKVAQKTVKPKVAKVAKVVAKKPVVSETKKVAAQGRAERAAKRRSGEPPVSAAKGSPVVDQKKAKVLAKVARKNASGHQKHQAPAKSKN